MESSINLDYLINHVFLPPQLPQGDDSNHVHDRAVLSKVFDSLSRFQRFPFAFECSQLQSCIKMIRSMMDLRLTSSGVIEPDKIRFQLRSICENDVLVYHLRGQNAGLIIRVLAREVVLEISELSPTNGAVMGTTGRLIRCFPGSAFSLDSDRFRDTTFVNALGELLERLDISTPNEAYTALDARKTGPGLIELRETINPKFATELLAGILLGMGQPIDVMRIHKHTRDDVLWDDMLLPWHRSPLWLLIRVSLQTSFKRELEGQNWYKLFMIFFMTNILEDAIQDDLPSHIIFIMSAKISTRSRKLKLAGENDIMKYVLETVTEAHTKMAKRWKAIEDDPRSANYLKEWQAHDWAFSEDTKLSIISLAPYLERIWVRGNISSDPHEFVPRCANRLEPMEIPQNLPPNGNIDLDISLTDVESWVQENLESWISAHMDSSDTAKRLEVLIVNYHKAASVSYFGNPEDISLMILTLLDLWVALDKFTTRYCTLLSQYKPGFSSKLFEPLLLPKKVQMERLFQIEKYTTQRNSSLYEPFLIFEDINNSQSFGVRYYEQSQCHKDLHHKIKTAAQRKRNNKREELLQKLNKYEELKRLAEPKNCLYTRSPVTGKQLHDSSCEKCQLRNEADNIGIRINEEPLPSRTLEAKSAIFELMVPSVFRVWRDVTYMLLIDVFSSPKCQPLSKLPYILEEYDGLKEYWNNERGRLHFASVAKPFLVSHYKMLPISMATEQNVLLDNNLRYSVFDESRKIFVDSVLSKYDIRPVCTPKLPSGPYQNFQYSLEATYHTSNETLARQLECPNALSLHEYGSFTNLRAGHRLQWLNIARELMSQVLNFNAPETNMLISQAAWQVCCQGPGICRDAHESLEELEFGMSLLRSLDDALQGIETNWQCVVAAKTFISLSVRLLSLSSHPEVHNGCYTFIRKARRITLYWVRDVEATLQNEQDQNVQKPSSMNLLELALVCHSTFNVDDQRISSVLQSSADVSALIECATIIHDHYPSMTETLPQPLKVLFRRYQRVSHTLEKFLRQKVLQSCEGINDAISRVWNNFDPITPWVALPVPNERWISITSKKSKKTLVHYNILNGSLLIDGKPLTRLPKEYETHKTYVRLFGKKNLNVIPSSMSGMDFEVRNSIFDQQIHFSMKQSQLIIRCQKGLETFELIPVEILVGDFPHSLVHDYTHWLNLRTREIEWRSLDNPWLSCTSNWVMRTNSEGAFLSQGSVRLIDIRSRTSRLLTKIFMPLEHVAHLHIALECDDGVLKIHLPRMGLEFFTTKPGHILESKQFRGMIVDEHQSFGVSTGLKNKLFLKNEKEVARSIVVPEGDVKFEKSGHHTLVQIDTGSNPSVRLHIYEIDTLLRRLLDNGTFQSRLYKFYLHALTSHCLVDQLTGRTGTEEALVGLMSAATLSSVELKPDNIALLHKIAKLTPERKFYPPRLQVMQQTRWRSISPLAQQTAFFKLVASILYEQKRLGVFKVSPESFDSLTGYGDLSLLERAAFREASFQLDDFAAEPLAKGHDQHYEARDSKIDAARRFRVCHITKLVDSWSQNLKVSFSLLARIESWGGMICGGISNVVDHDIHIGFDEKLLRTESSIFSEDWCRIHRFLITCQEKRDKFKVMVFLSTLAYSPHVNMELVQTLLALATVYELHHIRLPEEDFFKLSIGYQPKECQLITMIESHLRPFSSCPEHVLPVLYSESNSERLERVHQLYNDHVAEQTRGFARDLRLQWTHTLAVSLQSRLFESYKKYVYTDKVIEEVQEYFEECLKNSDFQKRIQQMQRVLDSLNPSTPNEAEKSYFITKSSYEKPLVSKTITFADLTLKPAPALSQLEMLDLSHFVSFDRTKPTTTQSLEYLLQKTSSNARNFHEKKYVTDLYMSFKALRKDSLPEFQVKYLKWLSPQISRSLELARSHLEGLYQLIGRFLYTNTCSIASAAQMLPRICPSTLLSNLAHLKVCKISPAWKLALVEYGVAITVVQRYERLLKCQDRSADLLAEIFNSGHQNWNPIDHPEWLLFEIENNLLIREEQINIALEMISPLSGLNSLVQLSMGLGKSSVVIPIVAAALADSEKLVRVVVLKPLASQMFNLLVRRLGGLINRRILYTPISRALPLGLSQAREIQSLYEEAKRTGSILLLQPEHILSFKLMGLEFIQANKFELGQILSGTQQWLDTNARDVLDESDEILSVKFELIYTIGLQRSIDFSPNRWLDIQYILRLIGEQALMMQDEVSDGLEIHQKFPGIFPRVRFLQVEASEKILKCVAQSLCYNGLPGLSVRNLSQNIKESLVVFLMESTWSTSSTRLLRNPIFDTEIIKKRLLLMKGLFGGVLRFAFEQKRWRVNYGLDPSRTMLAVPYHAKDTPAPRAEFSHPDTIIILTCLSYYYGGLTNEQIQSSFEALLKSDHSQVEYEKWVKDAPNLSPLFQKIESVNLKNSGLCLQDLFPPLKFSKAVIDFYLSTIVFPAQMKDFPHKLSSSGWDIAKQKRHPTTGFSGTNDSRYTLPLSISQHDLPAQLSTNAGLLNCLLRPENNVIDVSKSSISGNLDAETILNIVLESGSPIRVIIDVGAQVLEMTNEQLAQNWLSQTPPSDTQAVIFFNSHNEICVLTRNQKKEFLQTSPFAHQMDQCLVYLDESHTRGTDLKLPASYRAIVTLGPNLTKDRLVQACMRMRRLGKGQSVTFCGSMEVQRSIRECNKNKSSSITVHDVLTWSIANTCGYTKRVVPLWATQGNRHQHQEAHLPADAEEITKQHVDSIVEPDASTIEERYGNIADLADRVLFCDITEGLQSRSKELAEIRGKCREFEIENFKEAGFQEEQERELSQEKEREQQVERPRALSPHTHSIHEHVRELVMTGELISLSPAFCSAFNRFIKTSAGKFYESEAWQGSLLITTDFARTVDAGGDAILDDYLRTVHWILSYSKNGATGYVIISPYEAQGLLPDIRRHKKVTLHTYSARLNASTRPLDDLSYCAIPAKVTHQQDPSLVLLLNIFAGQLYFRDYAQYEFFCATLGLCSRSPGNDIEVSHDGFINPGSRHLLGGLVKSCWFRASPVPFVIAIMSLRRKGHSFEGSHIAKILSGELLELKDF